MKILQELQAMSDAELDRAVAEVQEFTEIKGNWNDTIYHDNKEKVIGNYHPTANTEAGRSQAFELMVKYRNEGKVKTAFLGLINRKGSLQKQIVIAVILSQQGK